MERSRESLIALRERVAGLTRSVGRVVFTDWLNPVVTMLALLLAFSLGAVNANLWWIAVPLLIIVMTKESAADRAFERGRKRALFDLANIVESSPTGSVRIVIEDQRTSEGQTHG